MVAEIVAAGEAQAVDWSAAEREARRAAWFVAVFVGAPAAVAAGAALVLFTLVWLVLVAPLVAAVLTWVAWRSARPDRRPRARARPA